MSKTPCTVYILGPMTGYPDFNRPAFKAMTDQLRARGFEVISPDELDDTAPAKGEQWADYLARDLQFVAKAHMGVALAGWRESRGATLEATILNTLGRPVMEMNHEGHLIPIPPDQLPYIIHPV